jgi:hypothetical protein
MFYDDLIEQLNKAAPILFVLLAGLIAHWLTVGRESRKEWLACCDELRPILMRERDAIGPYGGPGQMFYSDPQAVHAAVNKLLKLIR